MIEKKFLIHLKEDLGRRIKGIHDDSDNVVSLGSRRVKVKGYTQGGQDYVEIVVPDDWVVDTDEVLSRFKRPPPSLKGWTFHKNERNGTVWIYKQPSGAMPVNE